jgi:hypothetical protein
VRDARAVFLDIYRVITQRVVTVLETPGTGGFLEPEWLSGLTGRFAEDALIAVRASRSSCRWPRRTNERTQAFAAGSSGARLTSLKPSALAIW